MTGNSFDDVLDMTPLQTYELMPYAREKAKSMGATFDPRTGRPTTKTKVY